MKYFGLFYQVVPNFGERRTDYRPQHLDLVKAAHARGELIMAGALGDPPDGALLVFRSADHSTAEQFARADPYVINGLVTTWEVRPWKVVVGGTEP